MVSIPFPIWYGNCKRQYIWKTTVNVTSRIGEIENPQISKTRKNYV